MNSNEIYSIEREYPVYFSRRLVLKIMRSGFSKEEVEFGLRVELSGGASFGEAMDFIEMTKTGSFAFGMKEEKVK